MALSRVFSTIPRSVSKSSFSSDADPLITSRLDGNGLGAARSATDEADHNAAMGETISRLTRRRGISEQSAASLPLSDDDYPPSRPRRACEEC